MIYAINIFAGIVLVTLGLSGLHLNIEYSGWLLFVGIVIVLFSDSGESKDE